MPEPTPPSDRTPAERTADHEGLVRLSESLVPALVQKLNASALGELEVREGEWRIRLRRHHATAPRRERSRPGSTGVARPAAAPTAAAAAASGPAPDGADDPDRAVAFSPAVGVFRAVANVGAQVRSGDRIAVVDLLGIPQDVVAPADGILVEVFAETGEAVEYGEELALIEVAGGNGADAAGRDGDG
jgi:acetyl-CoA carboxylase biotin carboxyl carrier protein